MPNMWAQGCHGGSSFCPTALLNEKETEAVEVTLLTGQGSGHHATRTVKWLHVKMRPRPASALWNWPLLFGTARISPGWVQSPLLPQPWTESALLLIRSSESPRDPTYLVTLLSSGWAAPDSPQLPPLPPLILGASFPRRCPPDALSPRPGPGAAQQEKFPCRGPR